MKKLLLSILFAFTLFSAFAIPGATQYIPDASGEYVYYKDNTFNRESYVGILFYDDSSYKIRYYAPKDDVAMLPEKDLSILVSVNKDAIFWDMTGEYIMSHILPESEDTDLVNYLHDILYDFSARRNKIQDVESMSLRSSQDFPQFGGSVTIIFDAIVPIFNIRDIISVDGTKALECLCIGKLSSSEDKSFDSFSGFPQVQQEKAAKIPSKKAVKVSYEGKSLKLDENWTQSLENFWTLGNEALLTMAFIPDASKDKNYNNLFIIRKLMLSSLNSYINFQTSTINIDKKGNISLKCKSYDSQTNTNITTDKILQKKTGGFDFLSLAVYSDVYAANQSYFNKIVKSYK